MLDIPDFRVSMDLLPQHDDLQEPKVIKLGGIITSLLLRWVPHPAISTSPLRFRRQKGQVAGFGYWGIGPRPPEQLEIFPARRNIN
jgi:hypothetical protein